MLNWLFNFFAARYWYDCYIENGQMAKVYAKNFNDAFSVFFDKYGIKPVCIMPVDNVNDTSGSSGANMYQYVVSVQKTIISKENEVYKNFMKNVNQNEIQAQAVKLAWVDPNFKGI